MTKNRADRNAQRRRRIYSSLSALPSSKSIQKTYDESKEQECDSADSENSLDQLLDENFVPNETKQKNKNKKVSTPRRS